MATLSRNPNPKSSIQRNVTPPPFADDHEGSLNNSRSQNPNPTSLPSLLYVSFNPDSSSFTIGTKHGFQVFKCNPFREILHRDFSSLGFTIGGGGFAVVETVLGCKIFALVRSNSVIIWDDRQCRCTGQLSFLLDVLSVRLRADRVIVVLNSKIFVYNLSDLKLLHQIVTSTNPKGLCSVSQLDNSFVLACPGVQEGQIRVETYAALKQTTKYIYAHTSTVACLALTMDGKLLATASSKGTLVRVFNAVNGTLLQEVRRGTERAEIHSLSFSSTAHWLAVSSNKGTVHVFYLNANSESPASSAGTDVWTWVRSSVVGVLPKFFSAEKSVAQFHLPEGCQYLVAFGKQQNTLIILGMDGSFRRCSFDPVNGGEMIQLEYKNFHNPEEPLVHDISNYRSLFPSLNP